MEHMFGYSIDPITQEYLDACAKLINSLSDETNATKQAQILAELDELESELANYCGIDVYEM